MGCKEGKIKSIYAQMRKGSSHLLGIRGRVFVAPCDPIVSEKFCFLLKFLGEQDCNFAYIHTKLCYLIPIL